MVMLKRVTITFFKSIALYSILLLSFGLVFYSLYGEDKALKEKQMNDTSLRMIEMNFLIKLTVINYNHNWR